MSWWSHLTQGVGDWVGREWHNTERWLPEIGLGAAAIAAPWLAPELLAGGSALLGATGEAVGSGIGALGEGLGLASAEIPAAAESGIGASAAADLGTSSALGASDLSAIGSTGPTALGADPWAATVSGEVPEAAWGSAGPVGVSPESGLPLDPSAVPPGQAEFTPANPGNPTWTTEGSATPTSASLDPGQSVIQQTFGADYTPPSVANAESNVMQQGALGATADPSGAGGGGIMSNLFGSNSVLGGISNTDLLKYGIPLGYLAYTGLRGRNEIPPQANQAQQIAQQEGQVGASQLAAAESGQLTPPMQANIDIYVQNATNQLRQQYASAGRDWQRDTGYLQGVQQIQQQADAMRQKYIEMEFNTGLKASGQATAAMMQVAQLQFQEDKQFQDAIGNAMRMLGMAAIGGGGGLNIKL
jgi:hypothetical protein